MKKQPSHSAASQKLMLAFQKDEITSSCIYNRFSKHMKDQKNRNVIEKIAADEFKHAEIWKQYTQQNVGPDRLKIFWYGLLTYLLGYTFVIKLLEVNEFSGIKG